MSGIDKWDCNTSQASFVIHFGSSYLVIFDGMVCIVGITGRIVIVIKNDPGRLSLVNAVLS